jgi:hypothetical protein
MTKAGIQAKVLGLRRENGSYRYTVQVMVENDRPGAQPLKPKNIVWDSEGKAIEEDDGYSVLPEQSE